MTKEEIIRKFLELANEHGKHVGSDITVAKAIDWINIIFEDTE